MSTIRYMAIDAEGNRKLSVSHDVCKKVYDEHMVRPKGVYLIDEDGKLKPINITASSFHDRDDRPNSKTTELGRLQLEARKALAKISSGIERKKQGE